MLQRIYLIFTLITAWLLPVELIDAQGLGSDEFCEWFPIDLPAEVDEFVDFQISGESGLFFLATASEVFVKNDSHAGGWQSVFKLPAEKDSDAKITNIGISRNPSNNIFEAVYVFGESNAWIVTWSMVPQADAPWAVFHEQFESAEINLDSLGRRRAALDFLPHNSSTTLGFFSGESGALARLTSDGNTVFAQELEPLSARNPLFIEGLASTTIVWGYKSDSGLILDESGAILSKFSVKDVNNPANEVSINHVSVLQSRGVLAVATSSGVHLGSLDSTSGQLESDGLSQIIFPDQELEWVGSFLDQMVIASKQLVINQDQGTIAIENPNIDPTDILNLSSESFTVPPNGPRLLDEIHQLATDVLLVRADGILWELRPQGWYNLGDQGGLLSSFTLSTIAQSHSSIRVFSTLLSDALIGCRGVNLGINVFRLQLGSLPGHIVPDPSGLGAWLLEQPPSGVGGGAGSIKFVSPHGFFPAPVSTETSYRTSLQRLRLIGQDGSVSWPESDHGGVIIPTNDDFLWGYNGRYALLPYPDEYAGLMSMLPAGESGNGGLLALTTDEHPSVVRLDVSGESFFPDKVMLSKTTISCDESEALLVPDNERYVWMACAEGDTWRFERVDANNDDESDTTLLAARLPETPVALIKTATSGWVLTETGIAQIGNGGWSLMTSGTTESDNPLVASMLEEKRLESTVVWKQLWSSEPDTGIDKTSFEVLPPNVQLATPSQVVVRTLKSLGGFSSTTSGPAYLVDLTDDTPVAQILTSPDEDYLWGEPSRFDEAAYFVTSDSLKSTLQYSSTSITLGAMRGAMTASSYQSLDFLSDQHPFGSEFLMLAAENHAAVATKLNNGDTDVPILVPVQLNYQSEGDGAKQWGLDKAFGGDPLPTPDGPVEIRLAKHPADWWRTQSWPAQVRFDELDWTDVAADGTVQIRPVIGQPTQISFRTQSPSGTWNDVFHALPIEFQPNELARLPRWLIALTAALGLIALVAISRTLQERIQTLLGRRWSIATAEVDHEINVESSGSLHEAFVERTGGITPFSANPRQPCRTDTNELIRLPYLQPGENVRALIRGSELFSSHVWSKRIGATWSGGHDAIVAGMIATLDMESESAAFASKSEGDRNIAFRGLGLETYGPLYEQKFGMLLSPLTGVAMELDKVTRAFDRWNAKTQKHTNATREVLNTALRESNVIHIAAHASEDAIFLADGPYTVADVQALAITDIQCRLLVLSVCDAANIENTHMSLSYELVRRGVNLIGSVRPLDDILAKLFFAELYKNWLPAPGTQGIELATAIRLAADAIPMNAREQLDELVLYGDPTLQFVFR